MHTFCVCVRLCFVEFVCVALLSWNNESGNSFMRGAEAILSKKKGERWGDTQTVRLTKMNKSEEAY